MFFCGFPSPTLYSFAWLRMILSFNLRQLFTKSIITSCFLRNGVPKIASHSMLIIVVAHMLICIYAQSQSKYISVFSLISFLYYFHFTVHTPFQFFLNFSLFFLPFYSLQKPVTSTQHCWFCFRWSAHVPTHRAESNYIIHNACAHLGALSGVEAGGRNRYMQVETLTHVSLLSVLTVTEEFLLAKYSSF